MAFTRGYHVALLDDDVTPPTYPTQRRNVRRGINDTLAYADKISLIQMAPQVEDDDDGPCSTGFCLYSSDDPDPLPYSGPAVPNFHQFLVFKPSGLDRVTIVGLPPGTYSGEWLRVSDSAVQTLAKFTHGGGDLVRVSPWPMSNAAVLWIRDSSKIFCQ